MKKFLLILLIIPIIMGASCSNEKTNTEDKNSRTKNTLKVAQTDCNVSSCFFYLNDGRKFKVSDDYDNTKYKDYYNIIKTDAEVDLSQVNANKYMIIFIGSKPEPKVNQLNIRSDIYFIGYLIEE